jgi:hypothetical protein
MYSARGEIYKGAQFSNPPSMITLDVKMTEGDTKKRQQKKASPASKVQRIPHNFGIAGVARFSQNRISSKGFLRTDKFCVS